MRAQVEARRGVWRRGRRLVYVDLNVRDVVEVTVTCWFIERRDAHLVEEGVRERDIFDFPIIFDVRALARGLQLIGSTGSHFCSTSPRN